LPISEKEERRNRKLRPISYFLLRLKIFNHDLASCWISIYSIPCFFFGSYDSLHSYQRR
jgi:hypothetical protein